MKNLLKAIRYWDWRPFLSRQVKTLILPALVAFLAYLGDKWGWSPYLWDALEPALLEAGIALIASATIYDTKKLKEWYEDANAPEDFD
jgi:hypothetical protein